MAAHRRKCLSSCRIFHREGKALYFSELGWQEGRHGEQSQGRKSSSAKAGEADGHGILQELTGIQTDKTSLLMRGKLERL